MYGFGLCLWRLNSFEESASILDRILWLNPSDNQGVRFVIDDVHAEVSWEKSMANEQVRLSKAALERLVEEAIVDCYNESEQATGLYTMIEEHLKVPFETEILGVPVKVSAVDITEGDHSAT